jgi:type I restriction enzyme S subunit
MINKRYNDYKPISSYYYVNEIPEDWELLPNIALFAERIKKNNINEELLSVTISKGIIKQSDVQDKKDSSNEDKSNYKLVKINDLAYNKMRMWQGAVGFSKFQGIVSPAYIVLKPKAKVNSIFFHYLLRTGYYNNYVRRFSYGLCDDQLNLRYKDFKRMYSIVPHLKTQTKIAEYLDRKQKQASNFIAKQEKMIELLKEQKKAIINQAVTKGINPNVKMKDSGVEWLGEIPEHWEVSKIKFISVINPPKTNSKFTKNSMNLVCFLPMEAVSGEGEIDLSIKKKVKDLWDGFTFFARNDVIMAKITPCFENGKGAFLDKLDSEVGFGTTEFHVLRANKKINSKYLFYIFRTSNFKKLGVEHMTGTAGQKRVPVDFLANYPIGIPKINEQAQIVKYIESKTTKIDSAISKAEEEIKLVKEYLESLIFNVVTGKICVE